MPVTPLRPIEQMSADWRSIRHSPDSRRAFARLANVEPVVAMLGGNDLGDLTAELGPSDRPGHSAQSSRLLQAMVRSQRVHPLVPRAILQAVIPGLVTTARRLRWGSGGDWIGGDAFFVDLVTTTWEVIVEWSGQDRPYAVLDLLSAVRCRMRRQLLAQRRIRERVVPSLDLDRRLRPAWHNGTTDLDALARAIDRAGAEIEPDGASFLYASRILGLTVTELSRTTGRSRRFITEVRDRAARELVAQSCI